MSMLENNGRHSWGKSTYVIRDALRQKWEAASLWIKIEYKQVYTMNKHRSQHVQNIQKFNAGWKRYIMEYLSRIEKLLLNYRNIFLDYVKSNS